jgi:hypothetical protein
MSVPQSVATILRDHVTLEVESFDRLYLPYTEADRAAGYRYELSVLQAGSRSRRSS